VVNYYTDVYCCMCVSWWACDPERSGEMAEFAVVVSLVDEDGGKEEFLSACPPPEVVVAHTAPGRGDDA